MAIKWQDILKYSGSGTIGVLLILAFILNLSGMSYTHDGDKFCTNDCYSEIKVNSTYWEIKVEHAGDKDIIFKKNPLSRTLWLNLDKINEFVSTDPDIKTEIFVGTISKSAIVYHEDYGYLRPLKDGDILIHRITKSNPYPSRIIIHGNKSSEIDVKWSFILDDFLMEKIEIDPVWLGINEKNIFPKLIENKVDIVGGEATFEIINPFPNPLNFSDFNLNFNLVSGKPIDKLEYYMNYSQLHQSPIYGNNYTEVNTTCKKMESGKSFDYFCVKKIYDVIRYSNSYTEEWKKIDSLDSISPGKHKIKIVAHWKAGIRPQSIDWIPNLNLSAIKYNLEKDIFLTKSKWAWWNSSCRSKRQINFTISDRLEVAILNLTSGNFSGAQADGDDFRFVNSNENATFSYFLQDKSDSNWWRFRVENDNATSGYIYWDCPSFSSLSNISQVYATTPGTIVAAWFFDEASGNLRDYVGGINLVPNGTPLYNQPGKFDGAVGFNSNDDHFNQSNSSSVAINFQNITGVRTFHVGFWINTNATDDDRAIFSSNGNSNPRYEITTEFESSTKYFNGSVYHNDGSRAGENLNRSVSIIDDTKWKFLSVGVTGISGSAEDDYEMYWNTSLFESSTQEDKNASAGNVALGDIRSDRFFNGLIDEGFIINGSNQVGNRFDLENIVYTAYPTYTLGSVSSLLNITLNSPADNTNFSTSSVTFNGTVVSTDSDAVVNVSLVLDNSINQTNSSGFNNTNYIFIVSIADGIHTFTYQGCDNSSDPCINATSRTFTIDTTVPLAYSSPTKENNSNASQTWVFVNTSLTGETHPKNITFRIGNSTFSNITTRTTDGSANLSINFTTLAQGTYVYNATSCDTFSNCITLTDKYINLDTIKPSLSIIYPTNTTYVENITTDETPKRIDVIAADLRLSNCWYSINGGTTNITFTCANNASGLGAVNGTQTWYVGANDTAGNINWTSVTFTLNSIFVNFNVFLSSGITFTFSPANQTHQAVQPTGQNSTVGAITLNNNLTGSIDVYTKLNDTNSNITFKMGNSSNYSLSIFINTTHQKIFRNLTVNSTNYTWTWADYNSPNKQWYPKLTIKGAFITWLTFIHNLILP